MSTPSKLALKCLSMLENITSMPHLHQLHTQMIKLSLDQNPIAISKLISFSAISTQGDITYSSSLLSQTLNPTKFMYNVVIRGYSQTQQLEKSFICYSKMTNSGTSPDHFTFPFLLKSCSRLFDLGMGLQLHSQIMKLGLILDSYVASSLVYLYSSCGELDFGKNVFQGIQVKSLVNWNVMISGCVRSGVLVRKGVEFFQEMRLLCGEGDSFDEFSLVSVSSACANLGAFVLGKWVHGIVYKSGFCEVVPLCNALVDMYGKCGELNDACKVFDEMSVRDVVSWSTMIDVFAMHGLGRRAVRVFSEMEREGVAPDDGLFTSLLCACSHAGLLEEGRFWFARMRYEYGLKPKIQHYGCMVDLLGKAGQLNEAYKLIKEMPIRPDAGTWRSLVGACLFHGDYSLGKVAASELKSFDVDDSGNNVLISNVYCQLKRWDDVEKIRRGDVKNPGHSYIEVNNVVHEFFIRDNFHPQFDEIYLLVTRMTGQLKFSDNTSYNQ